MTIRDLSVIYDTHHKGINLIKILGLVDIKSLGDADKQKYRAFAAAVRKSSADPLVRILREWRNNIVAHYNYEIASTDREDFWTQNPLDEERLQTLIDNGFEILE
jgi:hypothetical protein